MTPELSEETVEATARVIYARYEELPSNVLKVPTPFPAWIEGGNSTMQDEARRTARAALNASGLLSRRETLKRLTEFIGSLPSDDATIAAYEDGRTALSEQTMTEEG